MKVVVLGAGGILGQHMMLCCPPGVEARYTRRQPDRLYAGLDCTDLGAVAAFLIAAQPDAVVNMVGEGQVDVVERSPARYAGLHVELPQRLALWSDLSGAHLVHVSSQAVFDGTQAPYHATDPRGYVNHYGVQKRSAEQAVESSNRWTIARVTFVLGIRPLAAIGRQNPLEQMLETDAPQVSDRHFSPSFAREVAQHLWEIACAPPRRAIVQLGAPVRTSRYEIAMTARALAGIEIDTKAVSHDDFPGLAARPLDTTFAESWGHPDPAAQLAVAVDDWRGATFHARMLALYFRRPEAEIAAALSAGFHHFHKQVELDFRRSMPADPATLLAWYRQTEAYIWELSAYHLDPGFNYAGMCRGIVGHLLHHGLPEVLCLGDGIGDLTLAAAKAGLRPTYHDLRGSRTADFAAFKFWATLRQNPAILLTDTWEPTLEREAYDAVVALDFFEHLPNVEAWAERVYHALRPGGQFLAQNAFGIGDDEHEGSIPMHLSVNNRYVTEWPRLLTRLGFILQPSGWWRKPGGDLELRAYE